MNKEAVIVGAVRTAIGNFQGALSGLPATELGSIVIQEALRRAFLKAEEIDEVIMGNVLQAGLGQNPARQAWLKGGLPHEVPALTVNRVCGSGLQAVILAAQSVLLGDADAVVAGGMESMSRAPYLVEGVRSGLRMGDGQLTDTMIRDGLWCALTDVHMGVTAENVAERYGLTRAELDAFAAESQCKAEQAMANKRFEAEIVPMFIPQKKGEAVRFDQDEYPRPGTTVERLAALRPAFKEGGIVTAGNASGINDGAAAMIVMSAEAAAGRGLQPLARIRGYAVSALDPSLMGLGPVEAIRRLRRRTGVSLDDIDLFELNEAFASQSIAVRQELGIPPEKINVNGGAIALGHPIGASGARIVVSLLYEMEKREAKRGIAALCVGGGQGVALLVERD
ncbi:acetyl-CoA C-acetyltransferase [Cohnella candidum]|uniref:acetyl-CoA C-acetyltransferase n=1 Tax=Cohnella candidum TaxID=2674991 RepID=A0A3G3JXT7_9BACL|nr:acetyl-CoA C-acetyltransferase [Cohnella candidum]AYQ73068.1 acetyl-CoA C-acetyltransferase [Cohnella candidum]